MPKFRQADGPSAPDPSTAPSPAGAGPPAPPPGAAGAGSPMVRPTPTLGHPGAEAFRSELARGDVDTAIRRYVRLPSGELREFYLRASATDDGWPAWADAIVEAHPTSSLAWCARGWQRVTWAWQQPSTGDAGVDALSEGLQQAEEELLHAAELDPTDSTPWSCLVTSGRGLHLPPEEVWRRYQHAIERSPDLLAAHRQMLQALCRKSGGSHEDMFAYAHDVSDQSPPGSPRHSIIVDAHLECWIDTGLAPEEYFGGGPDQQLIEAATRSVHHEGFADTPQFPYAASARNAFAVAYSLSGHRPQAWEQAHLMNGRLAEWPWSYLGDPAEVFAALLGAGPG